jgi:hypothetical protein
MKNIYIVNLESIDTRYTCEWKWHIPKLLEKYILENNLEYNVIDIDGDNIEESGATSSGAFLDFFATNAYKSSQLIKIVKLFQESKIKDGDQFIYTDAWNPTIIQLKYMSELMGINIKIHGMWHAGSYDPHDFLGKKLSKRWSYNFEKVLFNVIDINYFATNFHLKMFIETLLVQNHYNYGYTGFKEMVSRLGKKVVITGWPMDYMRDILQPYKTIEKENLILFPHRVSPEKQPEIFRDLQKSLPQYNWVVCQDNKLTKQEYHTLLAKSKIVFSANLQETLGISLYEGCILGAIPMAPNRLSYSEMYPSDFLYDDNWTLNYDNYIYHKDKIIRSICHFMENYNIYKDKVIDTENFLFENFFSGYKLVKNVLNLK